MLLKDLEVDDEILNMWNLKKKERELNPVRQKEEPKENDRAKKVTFKDETSEESESESSSSESDEQYETANSGSSEDEVAKDELIEQFENRKGIKQKDLLFLNTMRQLADSIKHSKPLRIKSLTKASQNVERWFEDYERHTYGWNNKDRAIELPAYLDEEPLKVWETASERVKSDYKDIKERLISQLNTTKWKSELRHQIYTAKQEANESISEFAQRLKSVLREWPESSQKEMREVMKETFIYNCNPNISKALLGSEKMHFKDLVKRARAIEEHENNMSKYELVNEINKVKLVNSVEKAEVSAPISSSNKIKCFKCNEFGHIAKNCTSGLKRNTKPNKCVAYGSEGHTFANCEQMKTLIQSVVKAKPENTNKERSKSCKICKTGSHLTKDCRRANNENRSDNKLKKRSN